MRPAPRKLVAVPPRSDSPALPRRTLAFLSAQLCAVRQTPKIGLGEPPGHLRCRLDLPVRIETSRRPFENAIDPRTGLMAIAYVSDQLTTTSSGDPQPQTVAFQK
jgi:hypothetical protein